jgi:photosystem II stability/assembly factor-like uncharacterized protein
MKPLTRSVLISLVALCVGQPLLFAQTWIQTSVPTNFWYSVASSADGSKLVAVNDGATGESIWTSTNSGATWVPLQTLAGQLTFVASSADGVTLTVLSPSQPVYTSLDSGNTWAQTLPGNDPEPWSSVAASADGTNLFLTSIGASNPPSIYASTNSGALWTATGAPKEFWHWVACSADGTKVIAGNSSYLIGGSVYLSTNSGTKWTPANLPSDHWNCVASSADGSKLAATAVDGLIYVSTNFGTDWTATSSPKKYWSCLASSADGNRLAAAGPGFLMTSEDSGLTWESNNVPALSWNSVACSADGHKLVATAYGAGIYTLQTAPSPLLSVGASGAGLLLSWIIPSQNFILQQNSDLGSTNWTKVGAAPVLNLKTLRNEVPITAPNDRMFYRLTAQQ